MCLWNQFSIGRQEFGHLLPGRVQERKWTHPSRAHIQKSSDLGSTDIQMPGSSSPTSPMTIPSPYSPGDGKETSEQREQLQGILGQVGGEHSQVEEVEDEELD